MRADGSSCPFCGSPSPRSSFGLGAAAVLMGLALAGCEKKGSGPTPPVEPEYGVPVSDTATPDDGGASPDDGGAMPDDGGAPSDDAGSMPAEPEYGVPDPG